MRRHEAVRRPSSSHLGLITQHGRRAAHDVHPSPCLVQSHTNRSPSLTTLSSRWTEVSVRVDVSCKATSCSLRPKKYNSTFNSERLAKFKTKIMSFFFRIERVENNAQCCHATHRQKSQSHHIKLLVDGGQHACRRVV